VTRNVCRYPIRSESSPPRAAEPAGVRVRACERSSSAISAGARLELGWSSAGARLDLACPSGSVDALERGPLGAVPLGDVVVEHALRESESRVHEPRAQQADREDEARVLQRAERHLQAVSWTGRGRVADAPQWRRGKGAPRQGGRRRSSWRAGWWRRALLPSGGREEPTHRQRPLARGGGRCAARAAAARSSTRRSRGCYRQA